MIRKYRARSYVWSMYISSRSSSPIPPFSVSRLVSGGDSTSFSFPFALGDFVAFFLPDFFVELPADGFSFFFLGARVGGPVTPVNLSISAAWDFGEGGMKSDVVIPAAAASTNVPPAVSDK